MFKIHPLTYLLIFISLLSGRFKQICLLLLLISFHEYGHFITARLFNWKIDKIYIYPLGGITRFNDRINKPFKEELLVAIMGPLFQIILTICLKDFDYNVVLFSNSLLFFNLLPILPLDGGRILNLVLSLFKPYSKSMIITIIISYMFYLFIFIYVLKISSIFYILVLSFLIFKIVEENKKIKEYYYTFIMERYLYINKYKNIKIIKRLKDMYKYRNNIIKDKNILYSEKDYIEINLSKMNCK